MCDCMTALASRAVAPGARADVRCRAHGGSNAVPRKTAVVGAGFAGVALAFELLEGANARGTALDVTLIDARGIAGGASGVAAGLLHPYTPRGKVIWRGREGVAAAKRLISLAVKAEDALDVVLNARCDDADGGWRDSVGRNTGERRNDAVARAPGIVRPARSAKQGVDFRRAFNARRVADIEAFKDDDDDDGATCLTTAETLALCPGLVFTEDVLEAEARADDVGCAGALYMPRGVVVDAPRYLSALWDACSIVASRGVAGTRAMFRTATVDNVEALYDEFDDVCLCCGAAVHALVNADDVPVQLQGGHVLVMKPDDGALTTGILGTTYVAPLGTSRAMVGPTKEYDATVEDARRAGVADRASTRGARAESALRDLALRAYAPTSAWDVVQLKYGVRANPPRSPAGALPLAGRTKTRAGGRWRPWFVAGLGARGLVYHALLARWVADAMLDDDITAIPEDVRRDSAP